MKEIEERLKAATDQLSATGSRRASTTNRVESGSQSCSLKSIEENVSKRELSRIVQEKIQKRYSREIQQTRDIQEIFKRDSKESREIQERSRRRVKWRETTRSHLLFERRNLGLGGAGLLGNHARLVGVVCAAVLVRKLARLRQLLLRGRERMRRARQLGLEQRCRLVRRQQSFDQLLDALALFLALARARQSTMNQCGGSVGGW